MVSVTLTVKGDMDDLAKSVYYLPIAQHLPGFVPLRAGLGSGTGTRR